MATPTPPKAPVSRGMDPPAAAIAPHDAATRDVAATEACFLLLEDAVRRSGPRAAADAPTIQFEVLTSPPRVWSYDAVRKGRVFEPVALRSPALVLRLPVEAVLDLFRPEREAEDLFEHVGAWGDLEALEALRDRLARGFDPISIRMKKEGRS